MNQDHSPGGRWPPIYDEDDLKAAIDSLVASGSMEARFYDLGWPISGIFQGDVIELNARQPFLDAEARPAASKNATRYWLVVGNSCDIDRSISEVPWTNLVPVHDIGPRGNIENNDLATLLRYKYSRRFYLPNWHGADKSSVFVANFLQMVTVDKRALDARKVVARLSRPGWVLLHSCVVRYLARSDGRYD